MIRMEIYPAYIKENPIPQYSDIGNHKHIPKRDTVKLPLNHINGFFYSLQRECKRCYKPVKKRWIWGLNRDKEYTYYPYCNEMCYFIDLI